MEESLTIWLIGMAVALIGGGLMICFREQNTLYDELDLNEIQFWIFLVAGGISFFIMAAIDPLYFYKSTSNLASIVVMFVIIAAVCMIMFAVMIAHDAFKDRDIRLLFVALIFLIIGAAITYPNSTLLIVLARMEPLTIWLVGMAIVLIGVGLEVISDFDSRRETQHMTGLFLGVSGITSWLIIIAINPSYILKPLSISAFIAVIVVNLVAVCLIVRAVTGLITLACSVFLFNCEGKKLHILYRIIYYAFTLLIGAVVTYPNSALLSFLAHIK